jgi:hypothetical protein
MAHQYYKAATLARQKTFGPLVVHAHLLRRKRADFREANQLKRIQTQINATGDRHVEITGREQRTGGVHGNERRGAGAVNGVTTTAQIVVITDASGDRV